MKPYDHQVILAAEIALLIKEYGIAYLAAEERTGKTLAAIIACELMKYKSILIITKKKALNGWYDTLDKYQHTKKYTVINYHKANIAKQHDLVILDEAHNYISAYPKTGTIWRAVKELTERKPIIYLSATPHAQGYQQLFHQFALSSYSPWKKHGNFYSWFRLFGEPYTIEINSIAIPQYDKCHEDLIIGTSEHLFITKTRQELGFVHEPTDKLHYIELSEDTKAVYNELLEHCIVELKAGTLVCDTSPKLRFSLHMLEGGTAKIREERIVLANREKIDYILKHFGDVDSLVIMYNYIAEKEKLEAIFENVTILQATSYAEGVDLSGYKDLVIYSQDFSTARHTQRRARQANKERDEPIVINYLLVKKAISQQVYRIVSKKKRNFVDSVFDREEL